MAIIKIPKAEGSPKECDGRQQPTATSDAYEFPDATEEELAFWNTLNEEEKSSLAGEATHKCFFELLHDFMQQEARKGVEQKIQDRELSGGQQPNPQSPVSPPDSPPTPRSPEHPPAPPTLAESS